MKKYLFVLLSLFLMTSSALAVTPVSPYPRDYTGPNSCITFPCSAIAFDIFNNAWFTNFINWLQQTPPPMNINGVINVTAPPYNADPTGATDSTTAFNNAVAAGPTFCPVGQYKVSSTVTLTGNGPTLIGPSGYNGCVIKWAGSGTTVFDVNNSKGATLKFMHIDGTSNAFGTGISVDEFSTRFHITDNYEINNNTGIGIEVGSTSDTNQASEGTVENNHVDQIGTCLIVGNVNAQNTSIRENNCSFKNYGFKGINGSAVIGHNWFGSNGSGGTGSYFYTDGSSEGGWKFAFNNILGTAPDTGIAFFTSTSATTQGNKFIGNTASFNYGSTLGNKVINDIATYAYALGSEWIDNTIQTTSDNTAYFTSNPTWVEGFFQGGTFSINGTSYNNGETGSIIPQAAFNTIITGHSANPNSRTAVIGNGGVLGFNNSSDTEEGAIFANGTTNMQFFSSLPIEIISNNKILNWDGTSTPQTLTIPGQYVSTLATGTAPFSVASATVNPNLNANLINGANFVSSTGTATIGTCGTSPSMISGSTDSYGGINVGSGTVTSCTVNFSKTLSAAPFCTVSDNSTTIFADISAVSTTAVTFSTGSSIGSGKIYYHCLGGS